MGQLHARVCKQRMPTPTCLGLSVGQSPGYLAEEWQIQTQVCLTLTDAPNPARTLLKPHPFSVVQFLRLQFAHIVLDGVPCQCQPALPAFLSTLNRF